MRTSASLSLAIFAGLFSTGQAIAQDQASSGPAQVGDKVAEFAFGPMLNGDGRSKLSEFRGQPILLDFWGTH
jgi:hypothetical protein